MESHRNSKPEIIDFDALNDKIDAFRDRSKDIERRLGSLEVIKSRQASRPQIRGHAYYAAPPRNEKASLSDVLDMIQDLRGEVADLASQQNKLRSELEDIRVRLC